MSTPVRPLRVLLVSDGKPGHFNLADGIVAAIARRRAVEVTRIGVTRPWWLPARVLSALVNAGEAGLARVPTLLGFGLPPTGGADLVVSAGGDTLAANIALARRCGCPNIFYGSLRRYSPSDFALVLTSYEANAGQPRHAMTLKPSALDPDTLPARPADGAASVTGLLVGGNSGTVTFSAGDWRRVEALLADGWWIVANSRRTPEPVGDAIARLAAASQGRIHFIDVRTAGPGTLGALFAGSDRIAVTLDSSSMVSEAVWVRKPVCVLAPSKSDLPAMEQAYRDHLSRQGWTATLALESATGERLDEAFAHVRPLADNPLDALCGLIEARIGDQLSASMTAIRSPA